MRYNYNFRGKYIPSILLILFSFSAFAQVGIGTITPNANAKLDITSTAAEPGGLLLPRVALTATNSPAPLTGTVEAGMAVYNTATAGTSPNNVTPGYYYNDGSKWVRIAAASGPNANWLLTGNIGTTPGTGANQNYLGTRDNQAMILATNNSQRLRILGNGQVIVNAITPFAGDRFTVQGNNSEFAINGLTSGANAAGVYGENVSTNGVGVFGNVATGFGVLGQSTGGGRGIQGSNNGTGIGVIGFSASSGVGVQGQNNSNGVGVFGANSGSGAGIQAMNSGNGDALEVFKSGPGDGVYNQVDAGDGIWNVIVNGSGIYNTILGTNKAAIISDLNATGGLGEFIAFGNKNGTGVNVSGVVDPNNPSAGTAGNVWGFRADVKTRTAMAGQTIYGGVLAANQYGVGHGMLMTHRGTSGTNVEFNSVNTSNNDPNISAVSLNRAPTIVAQNQNNSVGQVIAVADISYLGTDGRDHIGVSGYSIPVPTYGIGVQGEGQWYGVRGTNNGGTGYGVFADGGMGGSGVKYFVIDDPRDPENKYLRHMSIESNEVLNLYRGTAVFDSAGSALVQLPDYYDIINKNPSYQLTPIGASMPNLYIEKEVANGTFIIAGGVQGKKVSWVLTAERNDPYMRQNPQAGDVVVDKGPRRGQYLTPDLYGQPKEKAIGFYEPRKLEASEMVETTAPILEKKNKEKIEFKAEEYPKRITKKGEEKENALSQDEAQPSADNVTNKKPSQDVAQPSVNSLKKD